MIFRIIFYSLLFYFIYKIAKRFFAASKGSAEKKNVVHPQPNQSKININKEDAIEAEFEEITEPEKEAKKD